MKNKIHYTYFVAALFLMSCNISNRFYGTTYTDLEVTNHVYRLDLSNYKGEILLNDFHELRMLNLSNIKNVEVLQKAINSIPSPEKIEVLLLNNNQLQVLPKFLTKFTGLKHLSLNNNPQLDVAESFNNISTLPLEFLDLQFNNLNSIPKEIKEIQSLEEINFSNNNISNFNHLLELPKLRSLWLRNNRITHLDKSLQDLTQLVNLYLENNQLKELPKDLSGLTSLRVLHLSFNHFTELPEPLQTIPGVMLLHIDHCRIKTIPNTFNLKAASFKGLVINNNDLSSEDIKKWKSVFKSFFLLIF